MSLKGHVWFLEEGRWVIISSYSTVFIDLIKAYNKHKNEGAGFPKFKSEKNPNISFRIQANNNNIHLNERKNRIQMPTIGKIKFKTSKEHKQKIQESKINNITIKHENGIYTGGNLSAITN